jgi:type II secretory pathway pseudopilin PulG
MDIVSFIKPDAFGIVMIIIGIIASLAFFLVINPGLKAYELEQQKAKHNG